MRVIAICFCLIAVLASGTALAESGKTNGSPAWERIVMVGASATAGFTPSEPLGGPYTPLFSLNRYVDAALVAGHQPVTNLASALFFLAPESNGREQIRQAIDAKPTLLVGLDFLFWFCYGAVGKDLERLELFEKGLKMLETVPCPLVIGDLPDASNATNSMLTAEQVPSKRALSAANQRLKAWAGNRKQVAVIALSEFMRTAAANKPLTVHDYTLGQGQTRILLQDDLLHPSPPGCAVLALTILDVVSASESVLGPKDVRWDPKEVFRIVYKPKQTPAPPPKGGP